MPSLDYKEVWSAQGDGVTLVVTERQTEQGPKYTFAILRHYITKDGKVARTPWFFGHQVDAIIDLLAKNIVALSRFDTK